MATTGTPAPGKRLTALWQLRVEPGSAALWDAAAAKLRLTRADFIRQLATRASRITLRDQATDAE